MRMEVKRTSVMKKMCWQRKLMKQETWATKKAMILKDAEAFKVYRQVYEFLTNELGMENI